ncbi:hypothetical protein PRIPAC_73357 [Pristionchus pacificus]|uniref:Phospholipid scramblase n=1 Tax=Pristionchus pacificus TaxID=54126 RepID=A0A2A6C189_PRIPA|nr:hypothetical protein PRIPAC_73357 [Pristionchus pacificus]|eukprot:PDM71793.1 hypothetical protein PRIPAC_38200 [Pristionchus pacificus]
MRRNATTSSSIQQPDCCQPCPSLPTTATSRLDHRTSRYRTRYSIPTSFIPYQPTQVVLHTQQCSSRDTRRSKGAIHPHRNNSREATHRSSKCSNSRAAILHSNSSGYPPQQQHQQQGGYPPQQQHPPTQQQQPMPQQPMMQHQQQPMPMQPAMTPVHAAQPVAMVGGGGPPIVLAAGEQWMLVPVVPMGLTIPPGLEYLLPCAGAHVRQKTDIVEVLTDIDTPNKYCIYNDQGQFKQGLGGFVEAQLIGDSRGFYIVATDGMGRPSFAIARSSKLWTDAEMRVEAPPGVPAAYVVYNSSLCSRGGLTIFDVNHAPVLTIPFPSECDCNADRAYPVLSGGAAVGSVTRKYPGFMKSAFTTCDNFACVFPADLDVRIKAALLGCAIMIDFIDYEDKRK